VFSLLVTFLVVPRKYRLSTLQLGFLGIYILLLNPDSSICMNCCDSPWLFAVVGLCFAEDTYFYHLYFISDLVVIVNAFSVLVLIAMISK
jgi:hypothetical protein